MSATPETFASLMATRPPGATALIDGERAISFGALDDAGRRVAAGLAKLGVAKGDRIGLFLPNTPAWLALQLGCARLGAIVVAINTRFRAVELADVAGRAGCKILVLWPGFKSMDAVAVIEAADPAALAALETVIVYDEPEEAASKRPAGRWRIVRYRDLLAEAPFDGNRASGETPSNIFTTSGTTKAPKFVLHCQRALIRHGFDAARAFGYTAPGSVVLQATPFCGIYGFSQAMAALAAGCPNIVPPAFEAESAFHAIRKHRVTQFNGTDDMLARLLAVSDEERPFPSLRSFGCARFNTMLGDIVARAEARGVRAFGLFGMSETQALFARQSDDLPRARREVTGGLPVAPEAEVRARDPETGAIQPHGTPGELELKGPSLMVGYFGDEGATRAALTADGFFRTGDLGYTDGAGGFVFLSRIGDALRLGGYLVNPAEIESHIAQHPAIDGCQVVSVPTARGERAVAFVTLRPGAAFDEAALRAFCQGGLAGFKVPARLFALDAFPVATGPNGTKVQRGRLRTIAAERMGEGAS